MSVLDRLREPAHGLAAIKSRLRRPQFDSRLRRRMELLTYGAALVGVAVITLVGAMRAWQSSPSSNPDRLTQVGDLLAAGTLLLAALAAIVALRAYAAATGLPNLQFQLSFPFSQLNSPVFSATHNPDAGNFKIDPFKQTTAQISLRNTSSFSARNPAVIMRFHGLAHVRWLTQTTDEQGNSHIYTNDHPDWVTVDAITTVGTTAMQWDGGPTYSIHGYSTRRLPMIDLNDLYQYPSLGNPQIVFELLADGGYRREITIPVVILTGEQWSQYASRNSSDESETTAQAWL